MSYDGHLGFGLLGDYDALPELEAIALDIKSAIASLARAAGVRTGRTRTAKKGAKPKRATPKKATRRPRTTKRASAS
jgi:diacylglycerol O-acyltransferase